MRVKFTGDYGYVGTDYEEEREFDEDMSENDLEAIAEEIWQESNCGSWGYEILED